MAIAVEYDNENKTTTQKKLSPIAGSFSYYQGKTFTAHGEIPAGGEIFLEYGEKWLNERGEDFEAVPRRQDYWDVAKLLKELMEKVVKASPEQRKTLANELLQTHLKRLQEGPDGENPTIYQQRAMSLFPKTFQVLMQVMELATAATKEDLEGNDDVDISDNPIVPHWEHIADAIYTEISLDRRSIDFVKKHGMCLDNIIPGYSPKLGRGAIAQRQLTEGERIVPVPLMHMPDRSLFSVQDIDDLIVNYCFGHDESTLLLCPVTNALLINHCSNRTSVNVEDSTTYCSEGPNSKIQWGLDWDPNTNSSLSKTIEELGEVRFQEFAQPMSYFLHGFFLTYFLRFAIFSQELTVNCRLK
jgi:hypothetical protein